MLMADSTDNAALDAERKRAIRRHVVVLSLVAVAFYVGFIVLTALQ